MESASPSSLKAPANPPLEQWKAVSLAYTLDTQSVCNDCRHGKQDSSRV